ncbi:T9SS type B sorting domain-containing protein [Hymenobacter rubripertinctus]|uniref:Gliding motility-associated C-terminal domain-containing protein n=1 Tax=Hymenobacter rubripertinctus TaxID=2029981 RepID=A0A418QT71_9BACT|nr:gliding motility-associated C-terminal domain-containing protein [Hymenobacter rubripertinctus]RIY08268.1 gliding motility-associated C-terminal domain-containing protein [Hymenobacter rubripertinctus]
MRIPLLTRPVRLWLTGLLLLVLWLGNSPAAQATHLRAGDIQAKTDTTAARNPRRIFFKLVLYTSAEQGVADEPGVTIYFGDNTCTKDNEILRFSKQLISPDTYRNVYYFEHTYNAANVYKVIYLSNNRVAGVVNMSNSVGTPFEISTTVTIDPFLQNTSPALLAPAIDKAAVRQVFLHNPAAFDADGDSLVYALRPSQQAPKPSGCEPGIVDVAGFRYPADPSLGGSPVQVAYAGPPVGRPGEAAIFQQDPQTGQIVWNSPAVAGVYNIAFSVREYRRVPGGKARVIGEVVRDMQIIVTNTLNQRPILKVPLDICVVANTPVPGGTVTATDPDGNPVKLEAFGGMLPTPGSFVQSSKGPPTAQGLFRWTPTCLDIRQDPYQVLFKATDEPSNGQTPLIDERIWRITVIGAAPQNLRATLLGSTTRLDWDSYSCQNPNAQLLIFRRENSFPFTPGPCETGLPAAAGYTQIGSVSAGTRTFLDDNNGKGLERGKTYCYRIYVKFAAPAGGESLASNEACVALTGRSALLTNVTVDRTETVNGQITVRWTKPTSSVGFLAPLGYRLFRASGQSPAATDFAQVFTTTNLSDTIFVNQGLNTTATAYTYRLEFYHTPVSGSAEVVEKSGPASSVRVTATPNPLAGTIGVTWTYNVPWDNTRSPATIYRREPGGAFRPIAKVTGTATGGTFTDNGGGTPLLKNRTYCYYIKTKGIYASGVPADSLINLSQEQCANLQPVPCTPVLTLKPTNCDSLASRLFDLPTTPQTGMVYTNYLSWTLSNQPTADCSRDIVQYIILKGTLAGEPLKEIARVPGTQLFYQDGNLPSAQACYAVQAVDVNGALSAVSNSECKDNCLLFLLPNIFTPNGDRFNETFRPKVFSPIERTAIKIYNRWGKKVYESDKDPLINWTGGSSGEGNTNGRVSEGMYFYQAEVEFKDANHTKRVFKGWVQINR